LNDAKRSLFRHVKLALPKENMAPRVGEISYPMLRSVSKTEPFTQATSTLKNPAILGQQGQAY
jgi:hypothetical protein